METMHQAAAGISGGVATIFVSDMDRAVRFYSETLGLKLAFRAGNEWASIDAGQGFTIGLHPCREGWVPNRSGTGTQVGLNTKRPIREIVEDLRAAGVAFQGEIKEDAEGGINLAFFMDPDGNELYL